MGEVEMPLEPTMKRAIAFIDGQNLFHAAKVAFGYSYPNYDPLALSRAVCGNMGWDLVSVGFYAGFPAESESRFWHHFWTKKLACMGSRGVVVQGMPLRYVPKTFRFPDGTTRTELVGREKGIDIRIALDIVRGARARKYDVAIVFSQDQDLAEVAKEIRFIARDQDRWIKIASAYPCSPHSSNQRGIRGTDWIKIDKSTYDVCIDENDYRPPQVS